MAILSVKPGGTWLALPNPTAYKVTYSDLDSENTTRNEYGIMQRDRIRANIRKIEVTWEVGKTDYLAISSAIAAQKIRMRFFDPASAAVQEADVYAGDRSADLKVYINEAEPEKSRWNLTVSFVEF